MREINIDRIVVGDIAANCWIYPLAESYIPQGRILPPGFRGCALIDPGAEADRIMAFIEKLNLIPVYILLTHGHFDHIGALPGIISAGHKPIIAIHEADAQYLGPGSRQVHRESFTAVVGNASYVDEYLDSLWGDMPEPNLLLHEGDTIGPFTILHLPGHTQGGIAFWDKEGKNLFSGDTLFQANYGRTDLPGGSETKLFESLQRLFAMDSEIKVYPGHGAETTIGDEAARGLI